MGSWGSYPSIFTLGHKAIRHLLDHEVNVEEKVDGSQFSFGLVEPSEVDSVWSDSGLALKIRSKGCVMHIDAPEKMFALAGETVRRLAPILTQGWTYRGEFLAKPKHNALVYDRVPVGNIILYDVSTDDQGFLSYDDKTKEGERLGLEVVPRLYTGRIESIEDFRRFLDTTSVLGGQKIEGVVVKPRNYDLYGLDKKVLMGKFVSEAFKEVHRKAWGESNPTNKDVLALIIASLRMPTRWNKCIQHLREAGKLVDDVQDIGPIIREIPEDIRKEEEDWIKDQLFAHAWPSIRRGVCVGFPEFYKELLLKRAFEQEETDGTNPRLSEQE